MGDRARAGENDVMYQQIYECTSLLARHAWTTKCQTTTRIPLSILCAINLVILIRTSTTILKITSTREEEEEEEEEQSNLNLCGNERSSTRRVNLVVAVLRSNVDAILANVITRVANDQDLARSNATKSLVLVGIPKGNNYT
jgi:hypothetical protein